MPVGTEFSPEKRVAQVTRRRHWVGPLDGQAGDPCERGADLVAEHPDLTALDLA